MRSTLLEMLTYCRPAGSRTETTFRRRYLVNLPGAYEDVYGNIHVAIGESRCLWSCHTDTVHRHQGRQSISLTETIAHLPEGSRSTCLGADDTVGVYLLREMILHQIAGYYVFHYGEECGGIGSSSLAREHAAFLRAEFDCAIAVDRAGEADIITHQAGGRTCSPAFTDSLARGLAAAGSGLQYRGTHGVYTDTAEYAGIIPECSNLSVGYGAQHTRHEFVDVRHVDRLLGALCDLDTTRLVIARDPADHRVVTVDDLWRDDDPDDITADDYVRMTEAERRTLYDRW